MQTTDWKQLLWPSCPACGASAGDINERHQFECGTTVGARPFRYGEFQTYKDRTETCYLREIAKLNSQLSERSLQNIGQSLETMKGAKLVVELETEITALRAENTRLAEKLSAVRPTIAALVHARRIISLSVPELEKLARPTNSIRSMKQISIHTKLYGGAYIARSGKVTGSSTSDEETAVARVALKCFGKKGVWKGDCIKEGIALRQLLSIRAEHPKGIWEATLPSDEDFKTMAATAK